MHSLIPWRQPSSTLATSEHFHLWGLQDLIKKIYQPFIWCSITCNFTRRPHRFNSITLFWLAHIHQSALSSHHFHLVSRAPSSSFSSSSSLFLSSIQPIFLHSFMSAKKEGIWRCHNPDHHHCCTLFTRRSMYPSFYQCSSVNLIHEQSEPSKLHRITI